MWHYVKDGQAVGPIEHADLQRLVAQGEITSSTLVWREGMSDWQSYGELALKGVFGATAAAGAPAAPQFSEARNLSEERAVTALQPTQGGAVEDQAARPMGFCSV